LYLLWNVGRTPGLSTSGEGMYRYAVTAQADTLLGKRTKPGDARERRLGRSDRPRSEQVHWLVTRARSRRDIRGVSDEAAADALDVNNDHPTSAHHPPRGLSRRRAPRVSLDQRVDQTRSHGIR